LQIPMSISGYFPLKHSGKERLIRTPSNPECLDRRWSLWRILGNFRDDRTAATLQAIIRETPYQYLRL
jgi:hypothetical protein